MAKRLHNLDGGDADDDDGDGKSDESCKSSHIQKITLESRYILS